MIHTPKSLLFASAALALALGVQANPAWAADAAPANDSSNVVQTLVVTAQRKEEAIQDVPVAVSAFSADSLSKENIVGAQDLLHAIPNVNFAEGNFGGYNFQIRGIGTKTVGTTADAGISVHQNDVPLTENLLGSSEFFDVERVEVLRGPQGTLYGRNATGGVINTLTNKPTDRYEGEISAEYGNYNSTRIKGFVNLPITDTLSVRAAGSYLKRDGFTDNLQLNQKQDGRDLWSGRVTAQWKPTDSLRSYVMWEHFNEDDTRSRIGKQLCIHDPGPSAIGGVATNSVTQNNLSQGCQNGSIYGSNNNGLPNTAATLAGFYGVAIGLSTGDQNANNSTPTNYRDIFSPVIPKYNAKEDLFTWNTQYDITSHLLLTHEMAYNQVTYFSREDYDPGGSTPGTYNPAFSLPNVPGIIGAPVSGGTVSDPQTGTHNTLTTLDIESQHSRQFSDEARIQSSFTGPWNFSFGGNFLNYDTTSNYYVYSNGLTVPVEAINLATYAATGHTLYPTDFGSPNPTDGGANYYDNRTFYQLNAYAAFGELYYKPTDDLKFTAGARYGIDRKYDIGYGVKLLAAPGGPFTGPNGTSITCPTTGQTAQCLNGYLAVPQTVTFKEWTGRLNAEWTPHVSFTDKTLVYATYSRGYKPGGFNPAQSVGEAVAESFNPEFINSFEVGAKNTVLGGAAVINVTGFYYDYKGYQISEIVNRNSVNVNIDAKVYGAELEGLWSPAPHWQVNGTVGYLHTEISNGSTPDQLNLTNGDSTLSVVKDLTTSNGVAKTSDLATIQTMINLANSTPTNALQAGEKQIAGTLLSNVMSIAQSNPAIKLPALFASPNYLVTASGVNIATALFPLVTQGMLAAAPSPQVKALMQSMFGVNGLSLSGYGSTAGVPVNLSGKQLPDSPQLTLNLGVQYIWNLENGWRITPRADFYYQGESYARVFNTDHDLNKAWDITNLTLIVENRAMGLKAQAYVRNLFDKVYVQDQYLTDASSGLYTNTFLGDPRTYGVSLTKKF